MSRQIIVHTSQPSANVISVRVGEREEVRADWNPEYTAKQNHVAAADRAARAQYPDCHVGFDSSPEVADGVYTHRFTLLSRPTVTVSTYAHAYLENVYVPLCADCRAGDHGYELADDRPVTPPHTGICCGDNHPPIADAELVLFFLKRSDRAYDVNLAHVVAATSPAEARELAAARAQREGSQVWLDLDHTLCEAISDLQRRGIVLSSFRAG